MKIYLPLFLFINFIFSVDYSTEIQPIFNSNCTNCHNTGSTSFSNHELDLMSYFGLMSGGESGDVIVPGNHNASILYDEISDGDMPPGNSELDPSEIQLIALWINEGALLEEDLCSTAGGDDDMDGICGDVDQCHGDNSSGDSDMDGLCNDIDDCLGIYGLMTPYLMNDEGEDFIDTNGNEIWDEWEEFTDTNENGTWDEGGMWEFYQYDYDYDGVCDDGTDPCLGLYMSETTWTVDESTGLYTIEFIDTDMDGVCDDIDPCMGEYGVITSYFMDESGVWVFDEVDENGDGLCDDVADCASQGEIYCESDNFLDEASCNEESICSWDEGQCWYDCDSTCEDCNELKNNLADIPTAYAISKIYPNPFNPVTVIEFTLPEVSNILLNIYNINGNKVKELSSSLYSPGTHSISWDASSYPSGVYFIRMNLPEQQFIKKVMLIK